MRTYDRLADLPLQVDSHRFVGLVRDVSSDFTRRTTVVRLAGAGNEGVGEDVTYDPQDQQALQDWEHSLPLRGRYTIDSFSRHLDDLDLFPRRPNQDASRLYRRWAFEAAALDLALRQAGTSLASALELTPRPVRFVVSTRLGRPPTDDRVRRWLDHYPGLGFKLDATSEWDDALIEKLVATRAVEAVDFKGVYRGTIVDQQPDPALYRRVIQAFPEIWLEDPSLTPATNEVLAHDRERITWDAPIHSVDDIENLASVPRMLNIKPSRFGASSSLFAAYDHCAERGILTYGGGQFELGPGRGQIQYLAALFHPDAPNDVAPVAYNEADPRAGLPVSPLDPAIATTGFRREEDEST